MEVNKLNSERLHTQEVTTEFVLRDKDGNVKPLWNETRLGKFLRTHFNLIVRISYLTGFYALVLRTHNLITNVGHAGANGRMSNQGSYSPFIWLALGIGTGGPTATDTTLVSEIVTNGGQRASATASQVLTSVANDTTQLVHTWTFSGAFAITEEGILDAASTGNLLARQVFSAVNVANLDSLQVTHKYQT